MGRTQELLYFIREIKERQLLDFDFPVYVDSPLAIEATSIFNKNIRSCFDEEAIALVNAEITKLEGISGHADRNGFLAWVRAFSPKPRQVFVIP